MINMACIILVLLVVDAAHEGLCEITFSSGIGSSGFGNGTALRNVYFSESEFG